jgi:hypothetical protein
LLNSIFLNIYPTEKKTDSCRLENSSYLFGGMVLEEFELFIAFIICITLMEEVAELAGTFSDVLG